MEWIDNKSILTKQTKGFLAKSYTHTLNPYSGCAFAGTICGVYCYAQHTHMVPNRNGRLWGLYGGKQNAVTAYVESYRKMKFPARKSTPIKPLRIYMASFTDPYVPQEKTAKITRGILEAMVEYPPDVLVLQTRSPLVLRDKAIIKAISEKTKVWVSITVETDKLQIEGLPRHAFTPKDRLETALAFKEEGVPIQITVAPLLPLDNLETFTAELNRCCDRIILDHYLLGDGTKGKRTLKTKIPTVLEEKGYAEWLTLEKFYEVADYMKTVLGAERVKISEDGFNDI